MGALRKAEANYYKALPTRPDELPTYNKDMEKPNDVRRKVKKALREKIRRTVPALERERKEWVRVAMRMSQAVRNAREKGLFIEGRQWIVQEDPMSAHLAISHADVSLSRIGPMNGDLQDEYIRKHMNRIADLIMKGDLAKIDAPSTEGDAFLGFSVPSLESPAKMSHKLSTFARKQLKAQELQQMKAENLEQKERRRLVEQSSLESDQLSSLVREGKQKHLDDKERNKQYQWPKEQTIPFDSNDIRSRDQKAKDIYISIPYTTAASEFLYGLNVVTAALTAKRRQLYKLYVHKRARDHAPTMRALAEKANCEYVPVDDTFLPTMDKMAQGRPHNGTILEASPLPILPTTSLGPATPTSPVIPISIDKATAQSRGQTRLPDSIPHHHHGTWRRPLILMLDGILDPGNMGNILRTAHFYGVDAVAISANTCAPLNLPTVQKAASGAAETLTILSLKQPSAFLTSSKQNKWTVYAAMAPNPSSSNQYRDKQQLYTDTMVSPLERNPSILVIGGEGEGLRSNLADKAFRHVSIRGMGRQPEGLEAGVESLNVATSVGVLLEAFGRKPAFGESVRNNLGGKET